MAVVMSLFTMRHENKMVQQEKLCTSIKQSKKANNFRAKTNNSEGYPWHLTKFLIHFNNF